MSKNHAIALSLPGSKWKVFGDAQCHAAFGDMHMLADPSYTRSANQMIQAKPGAAIAKQITTNQIKNENRHNENERIANMSKFAKADKLN